MTLDIPLLAAIATVGFTFGFVAAAVAFRAWPTKLDVDALGIGAPTELPGPGGSA